VLRDNPYTALRLRASAHDRSDPLGIGPFFLEGRRVKPTTTSGLPGCPTTHVDRKLAKPRHDWAHHAYFARRSWSAACWYAPGQRPAESAPTRSVGRKVPTGCVTDQCTPPVPEPEMCTRCASQLAFSGRRSRDGARLRRLPSSLQTSQVRAIHWSALATNFLAQTGLPCQITAPAATRDQGGPRSTSDRDTIQSASVCSYVFSGPRMAP